MGSRSVTCYPAEVTFPPLPQPKLVLDLATPEGCKAGWPRWWLHPKIVNPRKTVTYLRNNQAVSCPGLEPATRRSQVQRPNHYTTRATGEYCSSSGSIIKGKFWTSFFVVNVALNCTILHIQIIMCIYIHCPFASIILMVVFSPFILLLKCL